MGYPVTSCPARRACRGHVGTSRATPHHGDVPAMPYAYPPPCPTRRTACTTARACAVPLYPCHTSDVTAPADSTCAHRTRCDSATRLDMLLKLCSVRLDSHQNRDGYLQVNRGISVGVESVLWWVYSRSQANELPRLVRPVRGHSARDPRNSGNARTARSQYHGGQSPQARESLQSGSYYRRLREPPRAGLEQRRDLRVSAGT